jgi:hypothetical protein
MTGTVVLVVFLPVMEFVVFTLPTVEFVAVVVLTLVEFNEVALVALLPSAIGALGI